MAIKFFDMFAGIGGFRSGLEAIGGFECIGYCEIDKYAKQVYEAMYDTGGELYFEDARKIIPEQLPHIDLITGGFPCQSFSIAGQRKGFEDNYKGMCRGTLFLDVARICEQHKPKVIFCENVKGLKIHDRGRTFEIIKKTFEDLGYKVFCAVLNSKDFGVPQNRERVYVVAFRNDVAPENFDFPNATDDSKRLKDIIEEKPVPAKYYLSDVYVETLRRHKARHEAKGNGFGYEIREWDGIAGLPVPRMSRNCLGLDWRLLGQKRLPMPPAMMTQ